MKKSPTVLKNVFLKSYGALRTFMQNNPSLCFDGNYYGKYDGKHVFYDMLDTIPILPVKSLKIMYEKGCRFGMAYVNSTL